MLKITNLAIGGQKQRKVHCRATFWQLQHPVQSFLQLQCISSLQACVASGRVVQHTASQPHSAFHLQPHSLGDGSSGAAIIIWAQQ